METKEMNEENAKVTGKNKNWQSGVSSSIGAAAGVVAGSMAQSAFAAEPVVEETTQPPHTTNSMATLVAVTCEDGAQMDDLANAAAQTDVMEDPALTADGGCGPDYTNDADVTGYMA